MTTTGEPARRLEPIGRWPKEWPGTANTIHEKFDTVHGVLAVLALITYLALTPHELPKIILFRFNDRKLLYALGLSGKSVFWAVHWQEPVLS